MKKLNLQIMVLYNFILLGKDPDPGSGSGGNFRIRIPNPDPGSGSCKKVRIRPDPDPQPWLKHAMPCHMCHINSQGASVCFSLLYKPTFCLGGWS